MYKAYLHHKKTLKLPDVASCDGETPSVGHLLDFPVGDAIARFRVKAVVHRNHNTKGFGSRQMSTLIHAEFEKLFTGEPDSY